MSKGPTSVSLKEIIAREEHEHPGFALGVEAITERRAFLHQLVGTREKAHLTQEEAGVQAGMLQPAVARLESGDGDPRLSTIQKYALALGYAVVLAPQKRSARWRALQELASSREHPKQ